MTDPEVYTVDEVAERLRVNRKTLYDVIARGEFPGVVKMGRVIRIRRPAFEAWLAGNE